jgi:hypothetical protein
MRARTGFITAVVFVACIVLLLVAVVTGHLG